ncbi:ly6/PLAUR domain-containing protein 6B [Pelodytes ibericus]
MAQAASSQPGEGQGKRSDGKLSGKIRTLSNRREESVGFHGNRATFRTLSNRREDSVGFHGDHSTFRTLSNRREDSVGFHGNRTTFRTLSNRRKDSIGFHGNRSTFRPCSLFHGFTLALWLRTDTLLMADISNFSMFWISHTNCQEDPGDGKIKLHSMLMPHPFLLCIFQLIMFTKYRTLARNINFHNVRPHLDPTPFPNSFKCFTCEKAIDNYNCNRWAEDKWCPANTHYCKTVHHFTSHGRSISVTKLCAAREECHHVGCHQHRGSGHLECISCCAGLICNVEVPTNNTNALFYALRSHRTSGGPRTTVYLPGSMLVIFLFVLL